MLLYALSAMEFVKGKLHIMCHMLVDCALDMYDGTGKFRAGKGKR